MSRICDLCARAYNQAVSRSHSNIATKRRQLVNLQTKTVLGVRSRVCTRCVRTLDKAAAEVIAARTPKKAVAKKSAPAKAAPKKAAAKKAKK